MIMETRRRLLGGLTVAVAAVAGGAYWGWTVGDGDRWAEISRDGRIRVGIAVEAPYVFYDGDGQLTGLEVETARTVIAGMGIGEIVWQPTEFRALIDDLYADRYDVIIAGMFITPARALRVSFGEPTFHVAPTLLVHAGNPLRLHSYEDILAASGAKVAVLHGAVEDTMVRAIGIPNDRIVSVPDALTGRVAVESGMADCLALSAPTIRKMLAAGDGRKLEMAVPFTPPATAAGRYSGYGAPAFRVDDRDIRAAWNRAAKAFIGSPVHRALLARFGFSDAELPGAMTTAEIVAAGGGR